MLSMIRPVMRVIAESMAAIEAARSAIGRQVRSMSTDRRGILRMNRLMAVPPLSANSGSAAMEGSARISKAT